MKEFVKRYPFITSLFLTGILIAVTFAVSKFADEKVFAGDTVLASAGSDAADALEEADAEEIQETEEITPVTEEPEAEEEIQDAEADVQTGEQAEEETAEELDVAADEPEEEVVLPENEDDAASEDIVDEHPIGVTEFVYYEPVKVNSKYYEDPGKRALTTNYPYSTVEKDFFNDAVFIGDSRTVGLFDYAGFDGADFFCDSGFCVYNWQKNGEVTFQNERATVNLMEALAERQYKKVYLMIGLNDCGYGNSETFRQGFEEMLSEIMERQPEAVIYLMANMYIAREKEDDIFNNVDINSKNVIVAECADGTRSFYLDYNDLYLDEDVYLKSELTFDGAHLYGKQYTPWVDFLLSHAVVTGD